jgi:hypothetical protein
MIYEYKCNTGTSIYEILRKDWILSEHILLDVLKELPYILERENEAFYAVATGRSFRVCDKSRMLELEKLYSDSNIKYKSYMMIAVINEENEYQFAIRKMENVKAEMDELDFAI